jgi:hypothetical protein
MRGWPQTAEKIAQALERHPGRILLTDDRKVMASLLYQLRDTPWRPVMWDYDGHPDHHYELTARYIPAPGDRVLLVAKWNDPQPILTQFNTSVLLEPVRVKIGVGQERVLHLFNLDGHASP